MQLVHVLFLFSFKTVCSLESKLDHNIRDVSGFPEKCYPELGCFGYDKDFFDIFYRPFDYVPEDREKINTTFELYTRSNLQQPNILKADDPKTITDSNLDRNLETKWIIHGFLTVSNDTWMREMKDAFLRVDSFNVIIVDWTGGNGPLYTQSSINTRLVGAEIAFLMKVLIQNGQEAAQQHIVGHSLGAHIAGYAGERISNIARITALDPAEPLFGSFKPEHRIDSTDAQFVDVIHSSAKSILLFGFGMIDAVGHVDFYPNGGASQPGCSVADYSDGDPIHESEGISGLVSCNHHRSIDLLIHAIDNQQCSMVGFACEDYDSFAAGKCYDCGENNQKCARIGLGAIDYKSRVQKDANNSVIPIKLFLKTSGQKPFCLFQYHVTVKLNNGVARSGQIIIILHGTRGSSDEIELGGQRMELLPEKSSNFLITSEEDLGDIRSLTFKWNSAFRLFRSNSKDVLPLGWVQVVPMIIDNENAIKMATKFFCQKVEQPVPTGKEISLETWKHCNSE